MSAFDIGISGMSTTARAIEVVSNNVANANTVGYKTGDYLFADQFFKALQPGEAGRIGQGVGDMGVKREFRTGAIRNTNSPLDLAINGTGFFRLTSGTVPDPAQVYYTRNGQFAVDKDGYLVNANGMYLTGYQPDETRTALTPTIAPLKIPPLDIEPKQTDAATLTVNLDARQNAPAVPFDSVDPASFNHSASMLVYDASGKAHTISLYYRRIEDGYVDATTHLPLTTSQSGGVAVTQYALYASADGAWLRAPAPVDGGHTSEPTPMLKGSATASSTISVTVQDQGGQVLTYEVTTDADGVWSLDLATATPKTGALAASGLADGTVTVGTSDPNATPMTFTVNTARPDLNYSTAAMGEARAAGPVSVVRFLNGTNVDSLMLDPSTGLPVTPTRLNFDYAPLPTVPSRAYLSLDLTGTTNFASGFEVRPTKQDGYTNGSLTSMYVDEAGRVQGSYSNGQSLMSGQITMAEFVGLGGLVPVGANVFAETLASGAPLLGTASNGAFGWIRATALEDSNIDMAGELVKLLVQQRNYQANSQSVRTQDELIKTVINMAG